MAFDSTNTYVSLADIRKRLSASGYLYAADVDSFDGALGTNELAYIETAAEYANQIIDAAICDLVSITSRPSNQWLTDRAVDIAVHRALTLGGREVTPVIQQSYEQALLWLDQVESKQRKVPGLTYEAKTMNTGRRAYGTPTVCNPK